MPADITIATPFVRNATAGARQAGYDVDTLLREAGIRPQLLHNDRGRVPAEAFIKLLRSLMRLMDDECLGLLDQPQRLGSFALIARSALHEESLLQAMHAYVQGANLISRGLVHELSDNGEHLSYSLRRREGTQIHSDYMVESAAMTAHRFFCWLGRVRIPIRRAELDYPPPAWAGEYRHLFYGAPVRFNAEHTRLLLLPPDRDAPLRRTLAELNAYIAAAPSDIFTPLSARLTSQQARRVILDALEREQRMPSSRDCALALQMAPQSFWRRLNREGTDYRTLRSEVRRDLALNLLRVSDLPIEAIAARSGYSESSAFIRAFREWTGMTPLAYRRLAN